jgi:hypothetical protein
VVENTSRADHYSCRIHYPSFYFDYFSFNSPSFRKEHDEWETGGHRAFDGKCMEHIGFFLLKSPNRADIP